MGLVGIAKQHIPPLFLQLLLRFIPLQFPLHDCKEIVLFDRSIQHTGQQRSTDLTLHRAVDHGPVQKRRSQIRPKHCQKIRKFMILQIIQILDTAYIFQVVLVKQLIRQCFIQTVHKILLVAGQYAVKPFPGTECVSLQLLTEQIRLCLFLFQLIGLTQIRFCRQSLCLIKNLRCILPDIGQIPVYLCTDLTHRSIQ